MKFGEKNANKCETCGCEILDGDRLCNSCYKKKVVMLFLIFFLAWIGTAAVTALLFQTPITFGISWFWFLLFPYFTKKSKYINKRRMYNSVPVTLEELIKKLANEHQYSDEYEKYFQNKDHLDIDLSSLPPSFVNHIQDTIYKKLPKCKTNKLTELPNCNLFVCNGSTTTADLLNTDNIHITPATARTNSFKKAPFITSIVVLCFAVAGVSAFSVYQYAEFKNLTSDYTKLQEEYDSLSAKYDDVIDEYSETQRNMVEARMELEKYQKYAVFVNEGSNYYHTYKCPLQKGSFWIYNINAAESRGYSPCPICRD
jgi:hypothetical protein